MKVSANIEHENLKGLYDEISKNLDNLEKIEFDDTEHLESSGLISMLVSLQNSHDHISIEKLNNSCINGLGQVILKK